MRSHEDSLVSAAFQLAGGVHHRHAWLWWPVQGTAWTRQPILHRPLTPPSLWPDITGPIILQTYRAIADFEKSSGSQMALATGDVVEVVEKSESGQSSCPAGTLLSRCLRPRLCPSASLRLPPCLVH